jgi:transketolase
MSARVAPRDVIGRTLTELGRRNPKVVCVDADFNPASKITEFKKAFPERFIQVGIAEQNMMCVAAGLATAGFIPFASTISAFTSRRACDQVTTSIALPRLNVKIMGLYPGLFVGKNGASHQSLEDIGIMRSIANMTILHPSDAVEMIQVLEWAAEYKGPVYIRVGRDPAPRMMPEGYRFQVGRSVVLREGGDVGVIAYGDLLEDTLTASDLLARKGIRATVLNMSSLKPLDEEGVVGLAGRTGRIVTVDNHNIIGGLGSAVAEVLCERRPTPMRRIGIRDVFGKSGTNDEMKKYFGITAEDIARQIEEFVRNRNQEEQPR